MIDVRHLGGTVVQGWHLTYDILGGGADGIVYVGNRDGREAAIKIFFPDALAKNGPNEALQRLDLQLSLKGKKYHPNVVEIIDGGKADELDGTLYLVMERVPGKSLDKILNDVPREAIHSLVKQLADAAQFLESRGLVHRDIKPANVVVSDDFSQLTLLDLGIVLTTYLENDERPSGEEFVATLRYSPPEFVWRKEESSSEDAWRAITFYQIGATFHDVIMRKLLFDGFDKPRARLYDAVRLQPPEIAAADCAEWLIQLVKCCLVKSWRERLQLVSWESFSGLPENGADLIHQGKMIKLRQIRNDEFRRAKEFDKETAPKSRRISELWDLQNKVFMETRQFLMGSQIFPKFSGTHSRIDDTHYKLLFEFETDLLLMFDTPIAVSIVLSIDTQYEMATELKVLAARDNGEIAFDGKWTEMLTVESASAIVQQSLMQVADKVVPPA